MNRKIIKAFTLGAISAYGFAAPVFVFSAKLDALPVQSDVAPSLDDNQRDAFLQHIKDKGIETTIDDWGKPTLVIHDLDGNELYVWPPGNEWPSLKEE